MTWNGTSGLPLSADTTVYLSSLVYIMYTVLMELETLNWSGYRFSEDGEGGGGLTVNY